MRQFLSHLYRYQIYIYVYIFDLFQQTKQNENMHFAYGSNECDFK